MRWMLTALLLLAVPSAWACTAISAAPQDVLLVVEADAKEYWKADTGMRFSANACFGPFRTPLNFDGRFATWTATEQGKAGVADVVDRSITTFTVTGPWSAGQGLLLDLPGQLRVRSLAAQNQTTLAPPADYGWHRVHETIAMAAKKDSNGVANPALGLWLYDAKGEAWIGQSLQPDQPPWPGNITRWEGFDSQWIVFGTQQALYAYNLSDSTVVGPISEPPGEGSSSLEGRPVAMLALRGSILYVVQTGAGGTPYSERAWSVDLLNATFRSYGRPPPLTMGGMTARFVVEPASTSGPTPTPSGESSGTESSTGNPPPTVPSLPFVIVATGLVLLAWGRRRA
jgi:hypothetical protein